MVIVYFQLDFIHDEYIRQPHRDAFKLARVYALNALNWFFGNWFESIVKYKKRILTSMSSSGGFLPVR